MANGLPEATLSNEGKEAAIQSVTDSEDYVVFTINYQGNKPGISCNTNLPQDVFYDFIERAIPGFLPSKQG
ncbi:hypothetical protein [Dyadobacter frigoris]|uniref:Uncharacterized protein n=1 Tax=Dyadobacter frigoris TaxID=2576211 RepID=A0A4U6CXR4_9BACT|nr:hypothetical protein [Dyadobacter frigoris]TKT89502.1 hypothetical protein FDK13_24475 [Dyadobacter frigoris]